jgi:hypothetical protein
MGAGLIGWFILLIVPRGSPWSALTFFSPIVLGRNLAGTGLPVAATWCLQILVSMVYGLIIARGVAGLKQARAVLTGGVLGLVLYAVNFGACTAFWPRLRGDEVSVAFTHIVFGLIAAGAYRGLLKRETANIPTTG